MEKQHSSPLPEDSLNVLEQDSALIDSFETDLVSQGLAPETIRVFSIGARHFLRWLRADGHDLHRVDDGTLRSFARHKCSCPPQLGWPGRYTPHRTPSRKAVKGAVRLVRFLEDRNLIACHLEDDSEKRLLELFKIHQTGLGYAPNTVFQMAGAAYHLLVWLHASRIPVSTLTPDVLASFYEHDCLCSARGFIRGRRVPSGNYKRNVGHFVRYLADNGHIANAGCFLPPKPDPFMSDYRQWLTNHRGLRERTITESIRNLARLTADLPKDPALWDARSLRAVISTNSRGLSPSTVQAYASNLRSYLRFLVVQGRCSPHLLQFTHPVPAYRHSSLPRYISLAEVERVIQFDELDMLLHIRNRAILLLLARLGLRASDIVALELTHLDWKNSRILLRGKTGEPTALNLPQDVGDGLLDYIEKARPRTSHPRVFLCVRGPVRPISRQIIGDAVCSAMESAGVSRPPGVSSHLFRHSLATGLLRSGVSMEVIGSLLRHKSPDSTMIYAKVDVPMLLEVAQPWHGADS